MENLYFQITVQVKKKTKDSSGKISKIAKVGKDQSRGQWEEQTHEEQLFPSKQEEDDETALVTPNVVVRSY